MEEYLLLLYAVRLFISDIEQLIISARSVLPGVAILRDGWRSLSFIKKNLIGEWHVRLLTGISKFLDPKHNTGIRDTGIGTCSDYFMKWWFYKKHALLHKNWLGFRLYFCNGAGLLGTIIGYSKIDSKWTLPLHDTYENFCLRGLPNGWHSKTFQRNCGIGEKVILQNGGNIKEQV